MGIIGGAAVHSKLGTGKESIVAILDTGVETGRAFFGGRIVHEACFSQPDKISETLCPNGKSKQFGADSAGCGDNVYGCEHRTHVAGIAAGKAVLENREKIAGVAPDAAIMAIQVCHFDKPKEKVLCNKADYSAAMDYTKEH